MAESLLYRAFSKKIHIALLLFFTLVMGNLNAQSLLLPGDMMFISVNSSNDTFEFVPLINIEKGTAFLISNGEWDNKEMKFRNGSALLFKANQNVEAGTPVYIRNGQSDNFNISGSLTLSEKEEQLFIYQQESTGNRFITAIGWGEKRNRRDRSLFGSDIPEIFEENPNTIVRLENSNNYQYHLRHGASGTVRMLNQFISNSGNWRGDDEKVFSSIGTYFKILNAPVILFDEAISSVEEDVKKSVLNVAIYEHDGSKLTVDVVFDSLYSTIGRDELDGFVSKKINFTGLIGDAVYEVEIPLTDDNTYEENETAIFNLENLSKGRAGDFISHTLFITDNEIPEIKLEVVSISETHVILVHNLERSTINLRDWEILKGSYEFIFPAEATLQVGETLMLVPTDYSFAKTDNVITLDEEISSIFDDEGNFQLRNERNQKISQVTFNKKRQNSTQRIAEFSENKISDTETRESTYTSTLTNSNKAISVLPGWKAVSEIDLKGNDLGEMELFFWDSREGVFKISSSSAQNQRDLILVGYFDEDASKKLSEIEKLKESPTGNDVLEFNLQSSDINDDGLLNGNEGFSLVRNNSDKILSSVLLSEKLKSQLEMDQSVQLFKSSQDFSSIKPFEENSMILPGSLFWIKLNEVLPSKAVLLNVEEISGTPDIQVKDETVETSSLTFAVIGSSLEAKFDINFIKETENKLFIENPSAIKDLYLSDFKGLTFTSHIAGNYYSDFSIDQESQNTTTLPIVFGAESNGEYELKVQSWENISPDFVILVEDQKDGKTYTLDENWSLKFDYYGANENNSEENFFPEIEERFVVKVVHISQLEVEDELPQDVELNQNYPNPFNPTTAISFFMPDESEVKLSVFNIVGQPVAVLFEGTKSAGEHIIEWDASDMPSGMYIYQLEVGTKIMTRKMTLVK